MLNNLDTQVFLLACLRMKKYNPSSEVIKSPLPGWGDLTSVHEFSASRTPV